MIAKLRIATIKPSHCRGDPPRNGDVVGGEKQPSEVCTCVKCAFVAFENYFCVTKNRNGSEWTEGEGGGARLISIPAFLRGCEGYWCSRCLLWEGKLKIPFSLSHVRRDEILRYRLVRNENSYYKEFRSSMSFFPIPESFLSSRRKLRMFNNISSSPFFISFPPQRGNDRVSRFLAKINKLFHARLRLNDASLTYYIGGRYKGRDESVEYV